MGIRQDLQDEQDGGNGCRRFSRENPVHPVRFSSACDTWGMQWDVLVIGGGPAGMRAAEVARAAGASVTLCEGQRAVGHKFLVAGRGGLNLTHGEAIENFPKRYGAEQERWRDLLREFGPDELRAWAMELGVETYVGSSGRIFPKGQKAAGILRRWTTRLREGGVKLETGLRLEALVREPTNWRATLRKERELIDLDAKAIVLALGGASWPETGSDGGWVPLLEKLGIAVTPWAPANCGWEVDWPLEFLAVADGLPLKNLTVRAGDMSVSGELLITRYGLEGGAIYRLGPVLRAMREPMLEIDFKPQLTREALHDRLGNGGISALKLSPAARALVERSPAPVIDALKTFRLKLERPRPIAEAISSAGGIAWSELDDALMVRRCPGLFVAGEMIDWEAPTGGYLLQGCFATGNRAGVRASAFALAAAAGSPK